MNENHLQQYQIFQPFWAIGQEIHQPFCTFSVSRSLQFVLSNRPHSRGVKIPGCRLPLLWIERSQCLRLWSCIPEKTPKNQQYGFHHYWACKRINYAHNNKEVTITEECRNQKYPMHNTGICSSDPIRVQVAENGKQLTRELDLGFAISIMSDNQKSRISRR